MANSYTTFPDSVQRFDLKTDVSSAVYSDWQQFNTYMANGQFANATTLLQSNTELQKCIIDSVYINKLSKTIEEVQDLFLNEIQTYIHETIINKGEWNANTKYVKYNFVTYPVNGITQTFECLRDDTPIATLPTNEIYWIPRVIQGEKGAPGLGLSPRGIWNDTALYLVNDFVSYNSSFWQCLNQNNNSEPTETNTNWLRLVDLSESMITTATEIATEIAIEKATSISTEIATDIANEIATEKATTISTEIANEIADNKINVAITNHNVLVNTEAGAHGFRYYQSELQYKNNGTWTTIETGVGGSYVGSSAPSNTEILWIDTGNGGVLKYYNGTKWTPSKAVWG